MIGSCETCGNEIIEGAKFCTNCGEKVVISGNLSAEDGVGIEENAISVKDSSPAVAWFYEIKGEKNGPVDEAQLKFLIGAGTVSYGTAVWKKGFPAWLKIENTELLELLHKDAPPPIPGAYIDNTLAWIIAFVPLIGSIIEYALFGEMVSFTFFIYWIANAALCTADSRRLAKSGYNTEKFESWFWLVPVYLFKRAKNLKHNYAYFIADIVVMILVIFADL